VESDLTGRGLARGLSRASQILADPDRQARRADGVRAVLLGSREREDGQVTIKDLATGEQQTFPRTELAERLGAARER
jgi:histidyl-tRNA synthetase